MPELIKNASFKRQIETGPGLSMGELGELNPSKLKGFVSCVCNLSREQSSLDYGRSPTRDNRGPWTCDRDGGQNTTISKGLADDWKHATPGKRRQV